MPSVTSTVSLLYTLVSRNFYLLILSYPSLLSASSSLHPSALCIIFLSLTSPSFLPLARSLVYLMSFVFPPVSHLSPPLSLTCLPTPQQVFPRVSGIGQELERTHPKLYSSVARQLSISLTSDKASYFRSSFFFAYIVLRNSFFFLPVSFPSLHFTLWSRQPSVFLFSS